MKIVYLSELKWRYLRTRKQQMVRRFPQSWRILFVEPYALGRENCFRRRQEQNVVHVTVPYFKNFPQAWLQKLMGCKLVRAAVIFANACWLEAVLQVSGFRRADVVVVSNLYYAPIVRLLFGKIPVIYDRNDDHLSFPMTPPWAPRYFFSLCRRADKIVCSSPSLTNQIPAEHRQKVLLIGNGVDTGLFKEAAHPAPEMAKMPRPVLVYLGALSEWLDMPLLQQVAAAHADKSLVLIGPVAPAVRPALTRLLLKPNAHHLGEISHDLIPGYLAAADVCLIPFVKNNLTAGVNPNKLYEYLAAGKPVVSIDFSADVAAIEHDVFLAHDHGSFVRQIDAALAAAHENIDRRRQFAFSNDWQEKAGQFRALIESLVTSRRARDASARL